MTNRACFVFICISTYITKVWWLSWLYNVIEYSKLLCIVNLLNKMYVGLWGQCSCDIQPVVWWLNQPKPEDFMKKRKFYRKLFGSLPKNQLLSAFVWKGTLFYTTSIFVWSGRERTDRRWFLRSLLELYCYYFLPETLPLMNH